VPALVAVAPASDGSAWVVLGRGLFRDPPRRVLVSVPLLDGEKRRRMLEPNDPDRFLGSASSTRTSDMHPPSTLVDNTFLDYRTSYVMHFITTSLAVNGLVPFRCGSKGGQPIPVTDLIPHCPSIKIFRECNWTSTIKLSDCTCMLGLC